MSTNQQPNFVITDFGRARLMQYGGQESCYIAVDVRGEGRCIVRTNVETYHELAALIPKIKSGSLWPKHFFEGEVEKVQGGEEGEGGGTAGCGHHHVTVISLNPNEPQFKCTDCGKVYSEGEEGEREVRRCAGCGSTDLSATSKTVLLCNTCGYENAR